MRTYNEIITDMRAAMLRNDVPALRVLADEMMTIGTPLAEAAASNMLGVACQHTGDFAAALEHHEHALRINEKLDNVAGVVVAVGNMGIVFYSIGDLGAALEQYHRALQIHIELGDSVGVARATSCIGLVRSDTGDYPTALEHFHRALQIYEEAGDRVGVARTLGEIGSVYFNTGEHSSALDYYRRGLQASEEVGDRNSVAHLTCHIGLVLMTTGDHSAALEYLQRGLDMYEDMGDRIGVVRTSCWIVHTLIELKAINEAASLFARLDAIPIDDPRVCNVREHQRATLQQLTGDLDDAHVTLQRALADALQHGLLGETSETHMALRELALKRNDLAGYVEHNREYTRIREEINGKDTARRLTIQVKQREIDAREREHAQHMAVLYSTLPKSIADRVARGEVVNDQYDNAAVIFLDIVGFTTISDRIPSGHVVHLLEQIFTNLDAVCQQHSVIKIKTMGDSYMAVSFDSVINAAACALDMITTLDALVITMPPELGDTAWTKDIGDIKVRIGMHCGPVTAGVIGTQRMQYDVWGDTVNVASRMESTSEPGRIHVSEALAAALSGSTTVMLTLRGETEVKGKGVMQTYWLESTSS